MERNVFGASQTQLPQMLDSHLNKKYLNLEDEASFEFLEIFFESIVEGMKKNIFICDLANEKEIQNLIDKVFGN